MVTALHKFAVALVVSIGWQPTMAASLTLPDQVHSSIRLTLESNPIDINPPDYFQVYIGQPESCCADKTPMAGRYRVENQSILFEPAFNFLENQVYTVAVHSQIYKRNAGENLTPNDTTGVAAYGDDHRLYDFIVPSNDKAIKPAVISIFPAGDQVPENTLRFYIHFSTPMKPHVSSDFIKLLDHAGTEIPAAFMAFKQELWSEDRRRLTVLMDPGRIKRGVAQNRTTGPALIEGNHYAVVVNEGWPSANGDQLTAAFQKHFLVTPALRKLPDTDDWKIVNPRVSTREPLTLIFDRAFDAVQLHSAINVHNLAGNKIPGTAKSDNREHTWTFTPQAPWADAAILLTVAQHLEDVAGNNFIELLDHSVETTVDDISHPYAKKIIPVSLKPTSG